MMVRRLQDGLAIVLCSLLLTSCSRTLGWTPDHAVKQHQVGSDDQPVPVTTLGQRALPSGARVVIYRFTDPRALDGNGIDWLGYGPGERAGVEWHLIDGFAAHTVAAAPAGTFIQYGTGTDRTGPMFVYGERLVPDVVAVEATFDTGETVRDAATDGVFLLAPPMATTAWLCELRVVGAHDAVLRTITDQLPLQGGPPGPLPTTCPTQP